MRVARISWLLLGGLLVLSACGQREAPLEGERLDLRADLSGENAVEEVAIDYGPAALPPQVTSQSWTHVGGAPSHLMQHQTLSASPTRIWSASIGQGNSRRNRISADPVLDAGRVFAMDSQSLVTAVSTSGAVIWSTDLTPARDQSTDASGGGLAATGGRVFATTGFGEVVALDATNGDEIWRQDIEAAASGAPTVSNGVVYAIGRDGIAWAINAATGRVEWTAAAIVDGPGVLGGAAPAVAGDFVYLPFRTGQISAARIENGQGAWVSRLSGQRLGFPTALISDLLGDPVVSGGVLYAGSHSGRSAAIDTATGQQIWSADEGAMNAPVVTANSVFQVTDRNALVRLDAATGETVWLTELPLYSANRERRRKDFFAHFGPVLAGGRLWVASDDDLLRAFDPDTGAQVGQVDLPSAATASPIVVGSTLYIVTANGQIHAFR